MPHSRCYEGGCKRGIILFVWAFFAWAPAGVISAVTWGMGACCTTLQETRRTNKYSIGGCLSCLQGCVPFFRNEWYTDTPTVWYVFNFATVFVCTVQSCAVQYQSSGRTTSHPFVLLLANFTLTTNVDPDCWPDNIRQCVQCASYFGLHCIIVSRLER